MYFIHFSAHILSQQVLKTPIYLIKVIWQQEDT